MLLLVQQEFGIELPIRSMGEYLKRWGFTPQKPITRAYEQRPEAVKAWLKEQYPAIAERAKREDVEFLAALVKDADKKIFLILDNLRVYHSKPVKAWLAEHKDQIEVFYLPSYSPDLNPDERLNADLKCALGSRVQTRTKDKLTQAAKAHMSLLEQQPERVRSYFNDPKVKRVSRILCKRCLY